MSIPLFLPVFVRRARNTPGSIFRFFLITGYPSATPFSGEESSA